MPGFYRAMRFSAERGLVIACRLSSLSVHPSVTLVDCDHICWKSLPGQVPPDMCPYPDNHHPHLYQHDLRIKSIFILFLS